MEHTAHLPPESLAPECRRVIDAARRDLGHDLRGYSVIDLVADQLDYARLDDLRAALKLIGEA